jgi:hypothetical protein
MANDGPPDSPKSKRFFEPTMRFWWGTVHLDELLKWLKEIKCETWILVALFVFTAGTSAVAGVAADWFFLRNIFSSTSTSTSTPPPPTPDAVEQTFYGFYGDLSRSGKTTLKKETMVLIQSRQSPQIRGGATGQTRGVTWVFQGYRAGDHLALTETRESTKSDPFPTSLATYYLQAVNDSYTGIITYWDRCLISVVKCPIVLSDSNLDVDGARMLWPNLLGQQCEKIDLVPDKAAPAPAPSCSSTAPN